MKALRETLRISSILLRYKLLQTVARLNLTKNKKASKKRQAGPVKARMGGLTLVLLYSFLSLSIIFSHFMTLTRMTRPDFIQHNAKAWQAAEILAAPSPIWNSLPQLYWVGLCVTLFIILLGSAVVPMARMSHATQDHELEWISTFPVSLRTFAFGRIFQSTAMSPYCWLFVVPILFVLVVMRGTDIFYSLCMAASLCVSSALLANSVGVVCDGFIQTCLSPARQRDARALAILLMSVLFSLSYFGFQSQMEWYWRWILNNLEHLSSHPLLLFMNEVFLVQSVQPILGLILLTVLVVFLSVAIFTRLHRRGLVQHSGYERLSVQRGRTVPHRFSMIDRIPLMVRREWQLLARDRAYLIQVIAPPLIYMGIHRMNLSTDSQEMPLGLRLTLVLMMPLIMLTTSATTLMQKERNSLWQYASAPRSLLDILGARQRFWLILSLGIASVGCAFFLNREDPSDPSLHFRILLLPVALWIFEGIALTMVIFFHDPHSGEAGKRPSLRQTYLLMTLSGIFIWAVAHAQPWNTLVVLTLMFGVKLAFRQKLNAYEPYVLDPSASPRAEASLGDGLIAALLYFILQSMIAGAGMLLSIFTPETAIMWSSLLAAVLTFVVMQLYYSRNQALGVPIYWGPVKALDGFYGLGAVAFLVAIAMFWGQHAPQWTFWTWLYTPPEAGPEVFKPSLALFVFAGLIAPIIEEFIFRGLIFGGMKRRYGLWPSLLVSSLIFAFCHPPLSFLPVFLLGVATGWLYQRTRVLLPGVLLHVAYNIAILSLSR